MAHGEIFWVETLPKEESPGLLCCLPWQGWSLHKSLWLITWTLELNRLDLNLAVSASICVILVTFFYSSKPPFLPYQNAEDTQRGQMGELNGTVMIAIYLWMLSVCQEPVLVISMEMLLFNPYNNCILPIW